VSTVSRDADNEIRKQIMTTSTTKALSEKQIAANVKRAATLAAKKLVKEQEIATLAALEALVQPETLAAIEPEAIEAIAEETSEEKPGFCAKWLMVLNSRIAEVYSKDTENVIKYITKSSVAIDNTASKPHFAEIARTIIVKSRNADNKTNKRDFVAVKVLVKVAHIMCALGQGLKSEIDNHTQIIGHQLRKLIYLTAITAKVIQCKRIVYDEMDTVQQIDLKHTANYREGTVSTQVSSSRQALDILGICSIVKGKKDDVISLQENDRRNDFVALFA